jgi:hypothetical protein
MANPPGLISGGLLGKIRGFGDDPAAAYGGLLSDPATQRQFALRSLGAAAAAFGQGAMPVPYKGGIPFGATLGAAGGAASSAGDSLIKARLEQAQQQALASVGLSHQQVELMQAALPGLKSLITTGQQGLLGGGAGTSGTGTGAALTGPAKIIADSKGTVFDTGDPFLNLVAHHESGFKPNVGWEGMPNSKDYSPGGTDLSGYALDKTGFPDWPGKMGPAGNSTAAGLFQITAQNWHNIAPSLIASGTMKPDFSPESQIAVAKVLLNQPNGKDNWLKYNPALAGAYARGDVVKVPSSAASPQTAGSPAATQPPAPTPQQTANGPPTGLLTPLPGGALPPGSEGATPGPQTGLLAPPPGAGPIPPSIARNSRGEPYQPMGPGDAVAAGTPGAGPVITPQQAAAANAGGGRGLPVMPSNYIFGTGKVAPPGAGTVTAPDVAGPPQAPPGPVGGLLGPQPTQVAAAGDAPALSPAAAAIAQGIANVQAGKGLLATGAVVGPGAPSGEPAAVAPADAAAARAAAMGQEGGGIPGLLQQPPPAGAAPTATPYTSAPPVTGQGAPAPGPAPASPIGPPVAPPLNLPPIPSQMPAMPNLPAVPPTPQQQIAQGVAGLMALSGHPAPPWIDDLAKMPAQMAMEQYKAWVGGQANMMTEQYKKQIEVAAAGTISYLQSQGQLPADLTKMTNEQNLKLRNEMATRGLMQGPDGNWKIMPEYLDLQGRIATSQAQGKAQYDIVDVPVVGPDGQLRNQKMTAAQASAYLSGRNGGTPGAASPGAAAAGSAPGAAGLPLLTPEQETQQKGVGETLGTEYKNVVDNQVNSLKAKPYLLSIQQALQTFNTPGAGATAKLDAFKAAQSTLQMAGLPVSQDLQNWIANGEIIGKSGTQLGFELTKSLGSRESQMIVQQAIANNPGLGTTLQGNKDLTALLGSVIDRAQDQRAFYDDWYQNPAHNKSFIGAQTAFNRANPWEVTVSQFAPYQADKIDKPAYDKLPPGVKVMKSNGDWWIKPQPGQAPSVQHGQAPGGQ